jgi:hypothetical protein
MATSKSSTNGSPRNGLRTARTWTVSPGSMRPFAGVTSEASISLAIFS